MNEFDYDLEKFVDDICIAMYSKVKTYHTAEEKWVALEAKSRLVAHGERLTRARASQMKYDGLKQNVETFKQVCNEDGIPLKD